MDGFVVETVTQWITVQPSVLNIRPSATFPATFSPVAATRVSSAASLPSALTATALTKALSTLPPLPSAFATPAVPQSGVQHDHPFLETPAVIATLVMVIIMGMLLLALLLVMVCTRFQGKCQHCGDKDRELSKWKSGGLKRVTAAMMRAREALQARSGQRSENGDVELAGQAADAASTADRGGPRTFTTTEAHPTSWPLPESTQPRAPSPVLDSINPSSSVYSQPDNIPDTTRTSRHLSPSSALAGSAHRTSSPINTLYPEYVAAVNAGLVDAHVDRVVYLAEYREAEETIAKGTGTDAEMRAANDVVARYEAQFRVPRRSRAYGGLDPPSWAR